MKNKDTGRREWIVLDYAVLAFAATGLVMFAVADYDWWWTLFYGAMLAVSAWSVGRLRERKRWERRGRDDGWWHMKTAATRYDDKEEAPEAPVMEREVVS